MGLNPAPHPAQVIELPAVPGLTRLYGKAIAPSPAAAATAVASAVATKLPFGAKAQPVVEASTLRLPELTLMARGVKGEGGRLVDYQRLVGEPTNNMLPAGYVHVLGFPLAMALMVRADFPLPVLGMVHLKNRVTMTRAIRAHESLDILAWAQNLSGHAKGTTVELVVEAQVDGDVVWRGVSTYLAKGKYLLGRGDVDGAGVDGTGAAAREFIAPLPTGRWELGSGVGRAYAAVSGDRNPIHMSALSAKPFGFKRAIAHGMYTGARALAQARPLRPEAFDWTIEFARPVLLPGTVDVSIRAADAGGGDGGGAGSEADGGATSGIVTYAGWNGRTGKPHFTGTITAR